MQIVRKAKNKMTDIDLGFFVLFCFVFTFMSLPDNDQDLKKKN